MESRSSRLLSVLVLCWVCTTRYSVQVMDSMTHPALQQLQNGYNMRVDGVADAWISVLCEGGDEGLMIGDVTPTTSGRLQHCREEGITARRGEEGLQSERYNTHQVLPIRLAGRYPFVTL